MYTCSSVISCIYHARIRKVLSGEPDVITFSVNTIIKTHGSESRGQGGSSKQRPDGLETHTREYYTGTRVVKIENAITKEP